MRAWLYYRLSRDEDEEQNSLNNQRKIIEEYALEKDYEIIGESFDDNISGMHFNREGIDKIYDAVELKQIDAVIVKDLSRLGRHRTQTALFIDYLREHNVKVLSVTENIDTSNENDDLLVGFKGIFNDFYARDIGRKIRAGYRQKQKDGMIIIPAMGYFRDKSNGVITVYEESANIIKQIFDWYADGYGLKAIAKKLNTAGLKSPSYFQKVLYNKNQGYQKPSITFQHLWESTAIKRILTNEIYTGTLVCHKVEHNRIDKTRKDIPTENQYRHENFVPAIISNEIWEQVQFLLADKPKRNVRAAEGKPMKRYTGMIKCGDCGSVFVAKSRYKANNPGYTEYTCNGYHRYGKEHCTPHQVRDDILDKIIYDELKLIKYQAQKNYKSIEKDVKKWMSQKNNMDKKLSALAEMIKKLDLEIENILMERINDKENRKIYDNMLIKRREEREKCTQQILSIKNIDKTIQMRKSAIKQSIDLIDDVITDGGISSTDLRMLVEQITIKNGKDGLQISLDIKADFATHFDMYEDNVCVEKSFEVVDHQLFDDWLGED